MATRMQQRRGTAAQWTAANPVLAAGEIGFETDTNKFKIGDGVNAWNTLVHYASAADLAALVDGAPALLNTLNELAASIGDDPDFLTTMTGLIENTGDDLGAHVSSDTNVHGISNTANIIYIADLDDHASTTTSVHGVADMTLLETTSGAQSKADAAVAAADTAADGKISTHNSDTTDVHGIADTSALETTSGSQTKADAAEDNAIAAAGSAADTKITDHNANTTSVHGIANTALLETLSGAQDKADAAEAAAILAAASAADTKISDHNSDSTNVHGITDTAALATKTYADGAVSTAVAALTKSSVGLANVNNTSDANKPVSTAQQTALDLKADLAGPTFTGTVSGITKSMVGLPNVDNTTDAGKPVSTATQTALDLKANLAAPTFTGTVVLPSTTSIGNVSATEIGYVDGVTSAIQTQIDAKAPKANPTFTGTVNAADITLSGNLTVNGTTTTVSSANLEITDPLIYIGTGNSANANDLGVVGHFDNGTYQHTGIVRDATDGKWKLFSGVTTEPTGTIDFTTYTKDALVIGALDATSATIGNVSNTELQYLDGVTSAIQTQIDAKSPTANPTFTGTVTVAASGVAFTDGTQTKAGVPSITTIPSALAAGAQAIGAGEQDKFIPLTGAVVITLPATGYSTGQSIDFYQASGTGAYFASTNGVVGTPGLKFRTTYSVVTAMKISGGWLVFGDLSL
jgi:hypothetical protein